MTLISERCDFKHFCFHFCHEEIWESNHHFRSHGRSWHGTNFLLPGLFDRWMVTLIHWIAIYLVDRVIQPLNNWALDRVFVSGNGTEWEGCYRGISCMLDTLILWNARGGTRYILGRGGAARPLIPWPCLRQISLIFLPCLRQDCDFWYPV